MKVIHARNPTPDKPIAIVGMGQPLKGDDSVGIMIIERLEKAGIPSKYLLINTGAVPENCTGILRKHSPNLILFIDAAQLNLLPGEIGLFHYSQVESLGVSTHSIPFDILCHYIVSEIKADIWILGIQPTQNNFLEPVSIEVQNSAEEIIQFFVSSAT